MSLRVVHTLQQCRIHLLSYLPTCNTVLPALLCCAAILSSQQTLAEEKVHDADPRNTQTSFALTSDDQGDLKIGLGTGGQLYGQDDESIQTQSIVFAEYRLQAEQGRFRLAHFDNRFGGLYTDIALQNFIDMYTIGYMVPMQTADASLMFFPSLNYTQVEFNTDEAAEAIVDSVNGPIVIDGVIFDEDRLSNMIDKILLDGDDSSGLGSLNLYTLAPWNETHFSLLQITSGSSYSGFDMKILDIYWMQGIRAQVAGHIVNIFAEAEYSKTEIQNIQNDDTRLGFGISIKF